MAALPRGASRSLNSRMQPPGPGTGRAGLGGACMAAEGQSPDRVGDSGWSMHGLHTRSAGQEGRHSSILV